MAELGSTTDPKALVPGDAAQLYTIADTLTSQAGVFEDVGESLGAVRIDGWSGTASSSFWDGFGAEKPAWLTGLDALTAAAGVLTAHADTVSWAQGQAADAIELYEKGQQATKKAMAAGELAAGGDPGAALRAEAHEKLAEARAQLKSAGTTNAAAIAGHGGHGPHAPAWLSGPAQYVSTPRFETTIAHSFYDRGTLAVAKEGSKRINQPEKWDLGRYWKDGFDRYKSFGHDFGADDKRAEQIRKARGQLKKPPVSVKLWDKSTGDRFTVGVEAEGARQFGGVTAAGAASADVGLKAGTSGSIGPDGLKASAHASAGATAAANGSLVAGPASLNGSAKAFAGAEASAEVTVRADRVNANVGGFAGARVEGEISGDVGGVGAGLKGEAWAGVGAEADITFGMGTDGKLHFGGEAGVGLGVGAKLGGEIVIDPAELTRTIDALDKLFD